MRQTIKEPLTPEEMKSLRQLWGVQPQRAEKVPHGEQLISRGFANPRGTKVALTTLGSGKLVYETTRRNWVSDAQWSRRRRQLRWLAAGVAVILVAIVSMTPWKAILKRSGT